MSLHGSALHKQLSNGLRMCVRVGKWQVLVNMLDTSNVQKGAKEAQPVHTFTILLQYSHLGKLSVGPITYADDEDGNLLPMLLCKEQYRKGSVEPSGKIYDIDSEVEKSKKAGNRLHHSPLDLAVVEK